MPPFLVLDKRNPRALERPGEDDERLSAQAHCRQHFQQFFDIMALDFLRPPAEGFKPPFVNAQVVFECRGLALTEPVHVHDRHQVIQLINPRQRRSLPYASLGAFAITHQHISAVIQLIEARAQRHAHTDAQTLAK